MKKYLFLILISIVSISSVIIYRAVFTGDKSTEPSDTSCIVTGCSGQICAEEEVITTCEFRPEYSCYRNARCERQSGGLCDWTSTEELLSCLQKN